MDDRETIATLRRDLATASPSADATARARRSVVESISPVRRRPARPTFRPRRVAIAIAVAALAVTGVAVGVVQPWNRDDAPLVPASRQAAERIVADPLLSRLVWVTDQSTATSGPARIQTLQEQPSLRFPPGVSYDQAFRRIYASLAENGTLPSEATLEPPLPAGKTLALGASPDQGIAIDLRSPRGYLIPSGIIPSGFATPASIGPEQSEAWIARARAQGLIVPLDAVMTPPDLEPCQILDPARPIPACQLSPPLP